MAKPKENCFIIETYDEEINMRVQFHYWTSGRYFYSSTREDTLNGIETSVDSKDDLEKAIKEGKVYSYSERIIRFYFPNKEQA